MASVNAPFPSRPAPQDRPSPLKHSHFKKIPSSRNWSPPPVVNIPNFASTDSVPRSGHLPHYPPGQFQTTWRSTTRPSHPSTNGSLRTSAPTFRPSSPYGFKPIRSHTTARQIGLSPIPRFSPAPRHSSGKDSPSYSIVTADTESMTLDSASQFSPTSFRPLTNDSTPPPPPSFICRPASSSSGEYSSFCGRLSPIASRKSPPLKGRQSPFHQQGDDNEVRKTRIKTELCMHYKKGDPCPFGANCTYAHGEEELQMTKLLDLSKAGLVDIETYRTKPCWTWVTTGSCPFGMRCAGIHDPRASGSQPSWLPHTETQGNTLSTDVNVEALHQKRNNDILYGNPFGRHFSMETDSWSDLYKLVCHVDYSKNSGWVDHRRRRPLDPIIKLQIALLMRGESNWQFKFRPQHVIHDEICMVLQQRAFQVTTTKHPETNSPSTQVSEVVLSSYNPHRPDHIMVHELAFGPDEDSTVRTVSLWFNIDEQDVAQCTQQQAKRFRWKKGIRKDAENKQRFKPLSVFEKQDHFPMIRPLGEEAFELATRLLEHRLQVLRAEKISSMRDRHERIQELNSLKKQLQDEFQNMFKQWKAWNWPVNMGREVVTKNTPVPPVDGKYEIDSKYEDKGADVAASVIWKSFATMDFKKEKATSETNDDERRLSSGLPKRLKPFAQLAEGEQIAWDRTLPHICHRHLSSKDALEPDQPQQEDCWKSLLLEPTNSETGTEWDLVEKHFKKSRSNKVLNIIQDKTSTITEQ